MTYEPGECDRLDCTNDWYALCFVDSNPGETPSLFIAYLCTDCIGDEPFCGYNDGINGEDYYGGDQRAVEDTNPNEPDCSTGCVCGDPLGQGA